MKAQRINYSETIAETELILRPDGSIYHLGIHPEQLASKVILVGDPERVPLISRHFDHVEFTSSNREFVVHTGTVNHKRISVVSTGIGVDNIDIVVNELDALVNIDLTSRRPKESLTHLQLVRVGTSGSLQRDIPTGSFVASAFACAWDGVPQSYGGIAEPPETELCDALKTAIPHLATQSGLYAVSSSSDLLSRIGGGMFAGITATANGFYGPQGRSLRLASLMEPVIDQLASFRHGDLRITNFEMECAGIYALASMMGHDAVTVCVILANRATKEFHKNPSASVEQLIHQVLERF